MPSAPLSHDNDLSIYFPCNKEGVSLFIPGNHKTWNCCSGSPFSPRRLSLTTVTLPCELLWICASCSILSSVNNCGISTFLVNRNRAEKVSLWLGPWFLSGTSSQSCRVVCDITSHHMALGYTWVEADGENNSAGCGQGEGDKFVSRANKDMNFTLVPSSPDYLHSSHSIFTMNLWPHFIVVSIQLEDFLRWFLWHQILLLKLIKGALIIR